MDKYLTCYYGRIKSSYTFLTLTLINVVKASVANKFKIFLSPDIFIIYIKHSFLASSKLCYFIITFKHLQANCEQML